MQVVKFDFFRFAKLTLGISLLAIVASILLFILGLNYGIDFKEAA